MFYEDDDDDDGRTDVEEYHVFLSEGGQIGTEPRHGKAGTTLERGRGRGMKLLVFISCSPLPAMYLGVL